MLNRAIHRQISDRRRPLSESVGNAPEHVATTELGMHVIYNKEHSSTEWHALLEIPNPLSDSSVDKIVLGDGDGYLHELE